MTYLLDTNACVAVLRDTSALSNSLILVTHNTREFSRVPGLVLEDWT